MNRQPFVALTVTLSLSMASMHAAPLEIAESGFPDFNCLIDADCSLTVRDVIAPIQLEGTVGEGFLQSRFFPVGEPGTPGEGLHTYLYRIDIRNLDGLFDVPCTVEFVIDFGPIAQLDYDSDGVFEDIFVGTFGGLGSVGPSSAEQSGDQISVAISVCAGATSFFFGAASTLPPGEVEATLVDNGGVSYTLDARAPTLPRFLDCIPHAPAVTEPGYYPTSIDCRDEATGEPLDSSDGLRYTWRYQYTDPTIEPVEVGPQESNEAVVPVHAGPYTPGWKVQDVNGVYTTWSDGTGDCVPPPPLTPRFGTVSSTAASTEDLASSTRPTFERIELSGAGTLGGSTVQALVDGTVYAGGGIADTGGLSGFVPRPGAQVTVDLNTTLSPDGYDIDSIVVLSADPDNREQAYDVEIKRPGEPGFLVLHIIGSASRGCDADTAIVPTDADRKELELTLSEDSREFIATGVEAVRFTFHSTTAYREIDILGSPSGPLTLQPLVRGDCNHDSFVDMSDALNALGFAFLGVVQPSCLDACDFNADGAIDVTNGVFLLRVLFFGEGSVAPPRTCDNGDPLRGCDESNCAS